MKRAYVLMDNALGLAKKENEVDTIGLSLMWKGRIAKHLPEQFSQEAEDNIVKGLALFTDLKLKPDMAMGHLFLGEHYAASSKPKQGLSHLGKAMESFESMGMDYWFGKAQKLVSNINRDPES